MRKVVIFSLILSIFSVVEISTADVLCARSSKNHSVKNRKVSIKLPSLLATSATTCPAGYREVFSVESATGTLSSGKTLTGVWVAGSGPNIEFTGTQISFQKQLAAAPQVEILRIGTTPTANCPGTVSDPTASPGYLCIYEGGSNNVAFISSYNERGQGAGTASKLGATISMIPVSFSSTFYAAGSFAVTAP